MPKAIAARNINLVEEPPQLYVAVRTILGFAQSSERRNIKCGFKKPISGVLRNSPGINENLKRLNAHV